VLEGFLSAEAAEVYQRLLVTGGVPIGDQEAGSEPMRELIRQGFARERYAGEPRVVPIEPVRAIENALLVAQQHILEQQTAIIRVRDQLELLQRTYLRSSAEHEPRNLVRVLTDPGEIGTLSVELCLGAQHEVRNLETAHFRTPPDPRQVQVPPAAVLSRGVRFRSIYSRAVLELPHADELVRRSTEAGWELRVVDELASKAVVVDGTAALLPLDPTGMSGAVLVRSPVIVGLLVTLFELLWARARPGNRLTPVQEHVLRLVLTGMTDAAIARHLKVSERTVRRHVATLLELLGVDNRVAAAVVTVREGWLDPPPAAAPGHVHSYGLPG
jgi:DNA-binding CsgD family transcriptional regulator